MTCRSTVTINYGYKYMLKTILNKLGFLPKSWGPSRASGIIYASAVNEARNPEYYATAGVPDTVEGRFDMITLMVSLALGRIGRISKGGDVLGQEIFDIMFADMDTNLREVGVSDEGMKYKIREMSGSFMGCMRTYGQLIESNAANDLWQDAISRNIFRSKDSIVSGSALLAKRALEINSFMDGLDDDSFTQGKDVFPKPRQ